MECIRSLYHRAQKILPTDRLKERIGRAAWEINALRWVLGKSPAVIMYHSVGVSGGVGNVSVQDFEEQIRWLTTHCDVTDLDDLIESVSNDNYTNSKKVSITFDDGLNSFYENAKPILEYYSCPATIYVIAASLENPEDLSVGDILERRLKTPETLMTHDELKRLADNTLFTIGAHTFTHPKLPHVDNADDLRRELVSSKEIIERKLGILANHFCYPYNYWDDKSYKLVSNNYRTATQHSPSHLINSKTDPHLIPRLSAKSDLFYLSDLFRRGS